MRKEDEDFLAYLFLFNTYALMLDSLSDQCVLVFFLTMLTPVEADGVTPTGAPAEIVRSPVISVPVRNVPGLPFFRQFGVMYTNLYRRWGSYPLIRLPASCHAQHGLVSY